MKEHEKLGGWTLIWWLFNIFGIPITLPWLIYHIYMILMKKHRRGLLNGKVVLITGASSGLGESLAHVFYNCGCRLILVSRRKEQLERVKQELISTHYTVPTHPPVIMPLDLTDINALPSEIAKVTMIHGHIDILINNAGISYRGDILNTNVDVDIKVMLTNYFAQIALTKAVLPSMIKQRDGHIVYVSSVQGKLAIPYRSAYGASKHALEAWCDSARAELSDKNIKITVISPGYIRTALSINALTGTGQTHGVMDKDLEEGYTAQYVAECILNAVLSNQKELIIAPVAPKVAIFLRWAFPSLYFWIMHRRAKRLAKEE
ncbi:dehydrogenase/reductase SDR family protein 7-like [Orussus abietinus]|uniref:dehydrogenase/reductase SDR family protein 7-like n=1 Tax=Orussus abietinus TaxID=222816 RepID=UPI00062531EF|nr:dehydrogenase/reductase SDR family protein 7-like [Orussus abietinus]XP_012273182.1 dehydrogenase/reductase SDR family protein 7-like [Orussus abietinus]XP_023290385.1 dehydrogenase/reductase SDR family protein 7-like [Orussus abietinus]